MTSASTNVETASSEKEPVAKRTPLCDEHVGLGARMVDFAGWWMPVQYKGLKEEHLCVRSAVGLFDVSHMGEFFVRGPKALETVQWLTSNDASVLKAGEAQYSLLPNADGGLVDDLYVYCIEPNENYLLCVNAANIEKDWQHVTKNNRGAELVNASADWAQIAVQGPKAPALLERLFPGFLEMEKNRHREFAFRSTQVRVATTGYTGEAGAEVFVPARHAVELWRKLLQSGADLGVQPIGLGARDSLRTEMKYSLYGHEIDDTTNPFEAGLGWVVKASAKDFLGRGAMLKVKERGLKRKLVGLEVLERGIARQGYSVHATSEAVSAGVERVGWCTSGTVSPCTGKTVAIAYVPIELAEVGKTVWIDIRSKPVRAQVCKTPFVEPGKIQ